MSHHQPQHPIDSGSPRRSHPATSAPTHPASGSSVSSSSQQQQQQQRRLPSSTATMRDEPQKEEEEEEDPPPPFPWYRERFACQEIGRYFPSTKRHLTWYVSVVVKFFGFLPWSFIQSAFWGALDGSHEHCQGRDAGSLHGPMNVLAGSLLLILIRSIDRFVLC